MQVETTPGRALSSGLAAQTAGAMPIALLGAQAPELQTQFGFGDAALGAAVAAYFLAAGLFAPMGGRVVDRRGPAFGLRLTGALSAVSLVIEATAQSFGVMVVGVLVGSLGQAIVTPASTVALIQHVPKHRQGFAFGLKQSAVPLAASLSGLSLPLVALTVGWRWSFVAMLIFPLLGAVLAPVGSGPELSSARSSSPRARPPRALVKLALVGVLAAGAVSTLNPFVVRGGTEAGFSTASAGILLSIAAGCLIVSRVVWGWILDRTGIEPVVVVFALLSTGVVGFALLATGVRASYAAGAVIAYGFGWAWPGVQFLAGVQIWSDNPGEASGVLQLGAFMGATVGPLVFGVLAQQRNFSVAFLVPMVASGCAAVMAGFLAREMVQLRRAAS